MKNQINEVPLPPVPAAVSPNLVAAAATVPLKAPKTAVLRAAERYIRRRDREAKLLNQGGQTL